MNPHVLILSSVYDFSVDLVTLQLRQDDVPYVRLNREQLSDHRFALNPLIPELSIEGPVGTHRIGRHLRSVWFRQPVFLRNTPSVPLSPAEQLERSQWMAFLRSLCVFDHVRWMNYPPATYLAESKPHQLSIAARCGFEVPRTLAGNDAEAIRRTFPGRFVLKSLDTVLLREDEDCLFTYTIVDPASKIHDGSIRDAPLLAQQELTNKTDIRVTVVGDAVWAVQILSNGSGVEGDWRTISKSDLSYEDLHLGRDITESCLTLLRTLGLTFGAIDLVETPEKLYFIEINPTGEWEWLASETRPIDRHIASWLAH